MDPQMADKVVDAGDGRIVSFPGSMSDEDIAKALRPPISTADNSKPTQFENERQPNRQPGVTRSLLSEVGDAIKSAPNMVRGMFDPATTARRAGALFEHDQDRAATRSPVYRAVADVGEAGGINAPGMEHDADIGNSRGIIGKATGDALMLAGPVAADMGLTAAKGRFPNYKAPEPRPFNWDKAVNRTTVGGALDLMSPNPTVGKAAMTAGAGLATEAVPWLANKVARSKPVVDFMTKRPAGKGPVPERVPLWKQAGIQEGKPDAGSNVSVTQVPEPTARPKSAPAVRSPLWKDVEAEGHGEPNVQVTHPPEPAARVHREPSAAPQLESAGDTATRLAGQPKNDPHDLSSLPPDVLQSLHDVAEDSADPELIRAMERDTGVKAGEPMEPEQIEPILRKETDRQTRENFSRPTPPNLPKLQGGNLPIGDAAKDAFQRFVKSGGKEGPLARQVKKPAPEPVKSLVSRRPDMQDDQAVRQEIEQRTQVRPKEPGRKGKAQLAADTKATNTNTEAQQFDRQIESQLSDTDRANQHVSNTANVKSMRTVLKRHGFIESEPNLFKLRSSHVLRMNPATDDWAIFRTPENNRFIGGGSIDGHASILEDVLQAEGALSKTFDGQSGKGIESQYNNAFKRIKKRLDDGGKK